MNKDLKARLSTLDKVREDLKKTEKSAYKELMSVLKDMMAQNPLIAGVRWQQYTPSFNDGEPCEFSINGPLIKFDEKITGVRDEDTDDDYEDGYIDANYDIDKDFFNKRKDILNFKEITALQKTVKDVCAVYSYIEGMSSILEEVFGSNMQITVTKDGVESEDYDCGH